MAALIAIMKVRKKNICALVELLNIRWHSIAGLVR
jgi:hypothetical protein